MKKIFMILSVVAIFGATSCTKEYTCECQAYDLNGDAVPSASSSATIEAKSESAAEEDCDAGDGESLGITVDCEIK